jgi:hypothetical protein
MKGKGPLVWTFVTGGLALLALGVWQLYQEHQVASANEELRRALASAISESSARDPKSISGRSRITVIDSIPLVVDPEAGNFDGRQAPSDEIPRSVLGVGDLQENDLFVRAGSRRGGSEGAGDGSFQSPWMDLQSAIDRLKPGDRLVVLGGRYLGPFKIGGSAAEGSRSEPIQVYFASDAELIGPDNSKECDEPVLSIERSHWILDGLTLAPRFCLEGLRIAAGVSAAAIRSPHISAGAGDGIVVSDGAQGIVLTDLHLHHLGSMEGRDRRTSKLTPSDSKASALRARESAVEVSGGKIHNIFGPALAIFDASGELLSADKLQAFIDRSSLGVAEGQEKWW